MISTNVFLVFVLCAGGVLAQENTPEKNKPPQTNNSGKEFYSLRQIKEPDCFVDCSQRNSKQYNEGECICKDGYYRTKKAKLDASLDYCTNCTACSSVQGNPYVGRSCDCGHNTYCCPEEDMEVVKKDNKEQCQRKVKPTSPFPTQANPTSEPPTRECAAMEERLSATLKIIANIVENKTSGMENKIIDMESKSSKMDKKISDIKDVETSSQNILITLIVLTVCFSVPSFFILLYMIWRLLRETKDL